MTVRGSITFLGTGTSTGVPEIGCDCATCTSTDPRDKRYRASAVIERDGAKVLIDCGPDIRDQLLAFPQGKIDAIFITHEHYDHIGGLDDLRPLFYRLGDCPIYAEPNVIEAIQTRLPYVFAKDRYPGVPNLDLRPIYIGESVTITPKFSITPLRVMHGKLPIAGYATDGLAYITDCKTLPVETIEAIKGVDLLVLNALRLYDHMAHLTLEEALQLIDQIKPRQSYLIHFAHTFGTHREIAKLCPPNVAPAYDGLRVDF